MADENNANDQIADRDRNNPSTSQQNHNNDTLNDDISIPSSAGTVQMSMLENRLENEMTKMGKMMKDTVSGLTEHMNQRLNQVDRKFNTLLVDLAPAVRNSNVNSSVTQPPVERTQNNQASGEPPIQCNSQPTLDRSQCKIKPQNYNGATDFDEFLAQFEVVSELNSWRYSEKSVYLASCLLERWPPETCPTLMLVNLHLVTATGESSPFQGKAEVEITLGSQRLSHNVLFGDVKNDGIIGMDFLTKHRCDMFLSRKHLLLNGEKIPCFRSVDALPTCSRIAILETVEVPPECEILVMGTTLDAVDSNSTGVLEATKSFIDRSGLLVAKALVCPEYGTVPLRIMNLGSEPYKLYKNTVAPVYEPVHIGKYEQVNSVSTVPIKYIETYSHVDELLHESSSNLKQAQVERLRSLLYDFKDQFSKSSHDLGCTNLVEHTIKTLPDSKPVKLRPYRIPLAKREFTKKMKFRQWLLILLGQHLLSLYPNETVQPGFAHTIEGLISSLYLTATLYQELMIL